ncbi:MAG: homogentisate phytyltransferase, partial [Cyanothece sp. SIO1E1]|nr:homogentisate phytyltransferase [Cyanothece sp. SIO1E1]
MYPPSPQKPDFSPQPVPWFYSFWKFSRPHTIIGTSLSVLGLYLIAWAIGDRPWTLGSGLLLISWAWLACISGNVYIVGLN